MQMMGLGDLTAILLGFVFLLLEFGVLVGAVIVGTLIAHRIMEKRRKLGPDIDRSVKASPTLSGR